jgi:hypothetical protein
MLALEAKAEELKADHASDIQKLEAKIHSDAYAKYQRELSAINRAIEA